MKKAVIVFFASALLLVAPFLWGWLHRDDPAPGQAGGLPWQIEALPAGGTRVMQLQPGLSPLAEARRLWPDGLELALLAHGPAEAGVVQAYAPDVRAGFVTGKVVLTAALSDPALLAGMQSRAVGRQPTASGGWRYTLGPQDEAAAWAAAVRVLAFHPSARLDEEVRLQRFGEPAERLSGGEGVSHWLYPGRGLAITCTPAGQCVFQYVAPAGFGALRAELLAPQAPMPAASGPHPGA